MLTTTMDQRLKYQAVLLLITFVSVVSFELSNTAGSNNNNNNNNNPSLSEVQTTKNVATQILQGVGPVDADRLNAYNLDYETCCQEWTANWVQKATATTPKRTLGCQSNSKYYIDTMAVEFPRSSHAPSSLGLELTELQGGGRSDSMGVTVVSNVIPEGAASNSNTCIRPGDSLTQVSLIRTTMKETNSKLQEFQEIMSVSAECLDYDATVRAIQSLTTPLEDLNQNKNDIWRLQIKRLRRKPVVRVKLQYPPNTPDQQDQIIEMNAGENLRYGLMVRGISLNDPTQPRYDGKAPGANCGGNSLCRTCFVAIAQGGDLLNPPRIAEKTILADKPRWRLSCKTILGYGMKEGDLTVRVFPNQW
jgi:ferredoxin